MGRPRALVAVVAGAFLLAGCGAGPSQVGTAAVVDGKVTSIDQVQDLLNRAVREQPYAQELASQHKLDLVGREIVRQTVLHEVVAKAARKEGLTADQSAITEALQKDPLAAAVPAGAVQDDAAGVTQLVWRLRDHREALTDQYLEQQLAVKYLPSLSINFDYTSIGAPTSEGQAPSVDAKTARSEAIAKAQEYAKNPNAIAAELQNGAQGNVGQQVPALSSPEDAATVLFGVPGNTAIAFQPNPASAPTWWVAAVVRQRSTGQQVATDQVQQPTAAQLGAIGVRMLQPYVGEVDYKINPRYGVWDSVGMNLAPSASELAGVVVPVHGGAPAQQ
ncbi:SurA N-terminal domain-containing protein [Amycolatopsis jiangsuensis]|uniref:SurA-like protein n=1 Tax=Amycolatopsis jiangsuensis TaxID=1181879 RepID=A0A840J4G6_9PSEU|nr:SurA N-terminal domain-containing protein [Amycolatopsis jiangsuensis]MBB4688298.1 hypothetical protein [Amycolatopsis jiangsuensis]